jgi:hypothetical protein
MDFIIKGTNKVMDIIMVAGRDSSMVRGRAIKFSVGINMDSY